MQAQLADGRILEFPDGTDPSVIQATVKKVIGGGFESVPEARMPVIQASRESGIIKGMTDPAAGLAQISEHLAPTTIPPEAVLAGVSTKPISNLIRQEEDIYQAERAKQGDEGFDWTRLVGNVASPATAPLFFAPMSQATLLGRMKAAVPVGAIGAGTQPVTDEDFGAAKAGQVIGGAVTAPLFPLLGKGVSETWKFGRSLFGKDIERNLIESLVRLSGANREKISTALKNAKQGETAQQALGRAVREAKARGDTDVFGTSIAKIEDELEKAQLTSDLISAVKAKQAAGREKAIGEIAETPENLRSAEVLRSAASADNYQTAFKLAVEGDDELAQIASNPYFKDMVKEAKKLTRAKESRGVDVGLTEYLHNVKLGLDNRLRIKAGDKGALDAAGVKEVQALKQQLVNWMEAKNPFYEQARLEHIELSKPINRMMIGKELEKGLISAAEKERAGPFLTAAEEAPRTIKRATGEARYKRYEDVPGMRSEDIASIEKVKEELLNIQMGKELASKKSGVLTSAIEPDKIEIPHILSRPVVIANTILRSIGKDRTPEYQAVLEELIMNPQKLGDYLALPASNPKRQIALDVMDKMNKLTASQTIGREVGQ